MRGGLPSVARSSWFRLVGDKTVIELLAAAPKLASAFRRVGILQSRAIREAHVGRPTLASKAAQALIRARREPPKVGFDLTEREREVLNPLIEGLSNPEIAERLVVSRSRIELYVSSILSKLGAASQTEAVVLAVKEARSTEESLVT